MYIVHKDVSELSRGDYQAFSRANFGEEEGIMKPYLIGCYKHGQPGKTISIWKSETNRRLIAWCLLTPVSLDGDAAVTRYAKSQSKYTAMFWVQWPYRGKGYGNILMNEVYKYDPRPHVMPHDEISEKFFKRHNTMIMNVDKQWRDS